ncbi:hypothetical protein CI15_20310 [Paraburkholderia monticola]|uniref:ADP-heptose--LPS heptosyltransferase n=1 Tax=Paraburkholderia monticola TaxID=1399968 RepID=A0A149PKF5_9BURK|nr:hypothetical protein [Paraburkholderia monticola]KXU85510.1 hypothetical protein CI15_20310 [Paraburkholderia monticola]
MELKDLTTTAELTRKLRTAQTRHEKNPYDLSNVSEICQTLIALKLEEKLLPWAEHALALNPNAPYFVALRALALNLLGRHAEAADAWTRDPSLLTEPAVYLLRRGYSLMMAGEFTRAITLLDEAGRMAASGNAGFLAASKHFLGEAMLKTGDSRGFTHWERRNGDSSSTGNYRPAGIPTWTSETGLNGQRVLITHQLGFGDNFLLAACVDDWLDAGASVMLTCDPQSHALMQASLPHCEVVSARRPTQLHEILPDEVQSHVETFAPQLHATLLHLPLLKSGATISSGYRFQPYIRPPLSKQQIAAEWALHLRAQHPWKKLVGLFWDCDQRHRPELGSIARCWATRRSLPLDAVNWLAENPAVANRVHFVNLHHPLVEPLAGAPARNVSRYLPGIQHFDDTAACIEQLDAVIAVDSGVANLAAMMGTPTCVPVNTSGDWRWGSEGTTSPWINGVTVLRQTREGDWDPVVRDIASWLQATSSPRAVS